MFSCTFRPPAATVALLTSLIWTVPGWADTPTGNSTVPIITVMSDFASCAEESPDATRTSLWREAQQVIAGLDDLDVDHVEWVSVCYSHDVIAMASSFTSGTYYGLSIAQLSQAIEAIAMQNADNYSLYLVGHGYGGWLAMELMRHLESTFVERLYTIDALSFRNCTPVDSAIESRSRLTSAPMRQGECTSAPSDQMHDIHEITGRIVGEWTNIFQTDNPGLHSSRIGAADHNFHLKAEGPRYTFHDELASNPWIWQLIEDQMRADLRL